VKVLFVTPMETSSGEATTALQMASTIAARGVEVQFLASPFTAAFIAPLFPGRVVEFSRDGTRNREIWAATLREYRPDVVVFADFPLIFFSSGAVPIAERDQWAASLEEAETCVLTLDHLGYAQRPVELFFGPPHLSIQREALPELPERMEVLLPCPLNEPSPLPGRRGAPFRVWNLPLGIAAERRTQVRERYLRDEEELLVFYPVSTWALRFVDAYALPYYRFLPHLLAQHLAGLARPVTVVSVNGALPEEPGGRQIRFLNESFLPPGDYDELLLSADLVVGENKVSTTLGKAICGLIPCALFRNSFRLRELLERLHGTLRTLVLEMEAARAGSVFPFDVFPIWSREELDLLGLFDRNSIGDAFEQLEIYEGASGIQLRRLLADAEARRQLRERQSSYVDRLTALPDAYEAIHRVAASGGSASSGATS
jgi:hypothetical protein